MISFMVFYLTKKDSSEEFYSNNQLESRIKILEKKQTKLNNFLNKDGDLLIDDLKNIFEKLKPVSYLELPLKIESERNNYPFGKEENVSETEE